MRLPIVLILLLAGCASPAQTPKQAKVESDFADCARDVGARGATITYVAPNGSFKWTSGGPGGVSKAQSNDMYACMRAKGYRFYDGPIPR